MSSVAPPVRRRVLAELLPGVEPLPRGHVARGRGLGVDAGARDLALIGGVALLTAAAAQIEVPLPFTPVPISGQTFAVLLGAAAVGPLRGTLGQVLYLALGLFLPFYSGGESGWQVLTGATAGYFAGFVVAAAVVGALARRGLDRRVGSTFVAFAVGSAVIYLLGAGWLVIGQGMTVAAAVAAGVTPFLLGDALKALLAAGLLPAAWRLTDRTTGDAR